VIECSVHDPHRHHTRAGRVFFVSLISFVGVAAPALAQSERARPKNTTGVACQVITGGEIQSSASVALALRGRATGLFLRETSGQAGAGSQIALRGINSLAFASPLVFIDGLKMAAAPGTGQAIGILDQLNPNDVLLIEIFRGPAATTLYGTDAAGGVIRLYTKHGHPRAELTSDAHARCLP
jgi:outer membrane cobalamin receptor